MFMPNGLDKSDARVLNPPTLDEMKLTVTPGSVDGAQGQ